MRRNRAMTMGAAALAAMLGLAAVAALGARAAEGALGGEIRPLARLVNSPLGRLVQANIGRLITLRAELNVSDEQREALRAIIDERKPALAAIAREAMQRRATLRAATLAESTDEVAIRAAAAELGKSLGDAAVLAAGMAAEARGVLSAAQIEKIETSRAERDQAILGFLDTLEQ